MDKWQRFAQDLGYKSERDMWEDRYRKAGSLKALAASLSLSAWLVKRKLKENGLQIQGRGGARRVKVHFDQALLEEMKTEGLSKTARRLGVTNYALLHRRKRWLEAHPEYRATPAPSDPEQQQPGSEAEPSSTETDRSLKG